ncbi:lipopolysaccharide biosynthesis protein [Pseudoalteromonas holothuriae]|nr:oligosaccharide flippase family protein [Pseudoalteromonas sp. CIP111854]
MFSLATFTGLNHISRVIMTLLLAKFMGAEHFGTFAVLLALCEVLLLPASMGFASSLMRLAHPLYKNHQHALLQGLKRVYLGAAVSFGLIFVAMVLIGYRLASPQALANEHLEYLLLIVPLGAIMQCQASFLIAVDAKRRGLLTQQSLFEILTAITCAFLYFKLGQLHLEIVCQALVVSISCVVVSQFVLIFPLLKKHKPAYQTRHWCSSSLRLLASGAGVALVAKLDVLLVHHWLGPKAVSVFYPAVVIAGLMAILSNAFGLVLKPMLLKARVDAIEVSHLMRLFWGCNFVFAALLAAAAYPLLALYNEPQLESGHTLLLILLLAQLVTPLRVCASSAINLVGEPLYNLWVLLFATTVTVLLAWYLQNHYGLIGIVWAFCFGFVLGAVIRAWLVFKQGYLNLSCIFSLSSQSVKAQL